jgi:energy-coupling factor transport system permease protein
MVLRFVPRYAAQLRVISGAQACVGRDASQGRLLKRARRGLTLLSIMTNLGAGERHRNGRFHAGAGVRAAGRTSFSLFRAGRRDRAAAAVMLALPWSILAGGLTGRDGMRFFPSVALPGQPFSASSPTPLIWFFACCPF